MLNFQDSPVLVFDKPEHILALVGYEKPYRFKDNAVLWTYFGQIKYQGIIHELAISMKLTILFFGEWCILVFKSYVQGA
jgi:hypothetical protein